MPIEHELLFGKVITKSGEVIKLAEGDLTEDRLHFKVKSLKGLEFIIPIEAGVTTLNCVERTYTPTKESSFNKLIVYNY